MEGECNGDDVVLKLLPPEDLSFNPCFYGGRMQLVVCVHLVIQWQKFQSLFLWRENATTEIDYEYTHWIGWGFNPCFYGGRMQQHNSYLQLIINQ